jgi:hypothetical protein
VLVVGPSILFKKWAAVVVGSVRAEYSPDCACGESMAAGWIEEAAAANAAAAMAASAY